MSTCAVLIPRSRRHDGLYQMCADSVAQSIATDCGPFHEIRTIAVESPGNGVEVGTLFDRAAAEALKNGVDWLFVLNGVEVAEPHAFSLASGTLGEFEVVAGRSSRCYVDPSGRLQRDDAGELVRRLADPLLVPHSGYFVRSRTAARHSFQPAFSPATALKSFIDLMGASRFFRLERPLAHRLWSTRLDAQSSESQQARHSVLEALQASDAVSLPLDVEFESGTTRFQLRIRDPGDMIQKYHLGGLFWESDELALIASRLQRGCVIVDVGAHIGNHAVYLAKKLAPRRIVLIEPNPKSAFHLGENLGLNQIRVADSSLVGIAAGRRAERAAIVDKFAGNSGGAFVKLQQDGSVRVAPLDELLKGIQRLDFLKIDVEHMELDVLAGAVSLIDRFRPEILIEVKKQHINKFTAWLPHLRYSVLKQFSNPLETNFYIVPT